MESTYQMENQVPWMEKPQGSYLDSVAYKNTAHPRLEKQVPLVTEQPGTIISAPTLGLPDIVKPFTLYVTEKDKVAMGCCPRLW